MKKEKKLVLAFSGGLDTSFCIPYFLEKNYQVITVTVNTGGFSKKELERISKASKKLGASKHYEIDATEELYQQVVKYIIKANYKRFGIYPTVVGGERGIQAFKVAEIAKKEKAGFVAHGSTGAGNDQVRFDLIIRALLPGAKILAPVREESLSRQEEVDFLNKHGHKFSAERADYSINVGLLGTTIGGKETLNTVESLPREKLYEQIIREQGTKATKEKGGKIYFKKGEACKFNGKKMSGIEIIKKLNEIAQGQKFGFEEYLGATIVGLKARIGFLAPALDILIKAHADLERITLTSKQLFWKDTLGKVYGDLIHEGLSIDPLVKDTEKFLDSSNEAVEGEVEFEISGGTVIIKNIKSPFSLFDAKNYSYGEGVKLWDGRDAEGFCKIYGTESVMAYLRRAN